MLVRGMLVMAAAATPVVWTTRLDAVRRGIDYGFSSGSREARLLFGKGSFDFFSRQDEGDEYGFAATGV